MRASFLNKWQHTHEDGDDDERERNGQIKSIETCCEILQAIRRHRIGTSGGMTMHAAKVRGAIPFAEVVRHHY